MRLAVSTYQKKNAMRKNYFILLTGLLLFCEYLNAQTPVHSWSFDGSVVDATATLNGTINGPNVSFGTNRNGTPSSTLEIGTGGASYVHLAGSKTDLAFMSNTKTFTVSLWFKSNANPITANQILMGNANTHQKGFYIQLQNGQFSAALTDGSGPAGSVGVAGNVSISQNTWYHLAVVADGTDMYLYVNGILDDKESLAGFTATTGDNDYDFFVGSRNVTGTAQLQVQNGSFDDLKIYDQAISRAAMYTLGGINSGTANALALPTGYSITPNHYWPLNNSVHDSGGNLNGYLLGDNLSFVADSDGNAEGAIRFGTGLASYVDLAGSKNDLSFIANSGVFSISFWVKPEDTSSSQMLLGNSTGTQKGFYFLMQGGVFKAGLSAGTGAAGQVNLSGSTPYTGNEWHHIVLLGDGSQMTLYVNGVMDGQESLSTYPLPLSGADDFDLFLGARNSAGVVNSQTNNASLDELRVYNQAIPQSEIFALGSLTTGDPNSTASANGCGNITPLHHWPLDNGGNDALGSLNGYLLGTGGTYVDDRDSNASAALGFDATNTAYVNLLGSKDALSFISNTASFSVSLWAKSSNTTASQVLIGNASFDQKGFYVIMQNGKFGAQISNGQGGAGQVLLEGTTTYASDQWYHITVTGDGTDFKLYVDGILEDEQSLSAYTFPTGADPYDAFIGARNIAGSPQFSAKNTSVDDIRVYNTPIPVSEILILGGTVPCTPGSAGSGLWSQMEGTSHIFYNNGTVTVGEAYTHPDYRLAVQGKIITDGIKVRTYENWPDYVFVNDYPLMPLSQLETYLAENGHLPRVPSAHEVEEAGFDLQKMDAVLLEKIEELTLYAIEADKKLRSLETVKAENERLRLSLEALLKRIERLETQNSPRQH